MINYREKAKKIWEKFQINYPESVKHTEYGESLSLVAFMEGYNQGLEFALNQKPIK